MTSGNGFGNIFLKATFQTIARGANPFPTRAVLEAVLWILNTGAQWHLLADCYPNYKTVHRRFQQWCQREILREILT
jgi:transposase